MGILFLEGEFKIEKLKISKFEMVVFLFFVSMVFPLLREIKLHGNLFPKRKIQDFSISKFGGFWGFFSLHVFFPLKRNQTSWALCS